MPVYRTKENPRLRMDMTLDSILVVEDLDDYYYAFNEPCVFEATAHQVLNHYLLNGVPFDKYFITFKDEEIIFLDWYN